MATFSELKQRVASRLIDANKTAVSDSEIAGLLNEALKYCKQERYWFNQATVPVSTVINDPVLSITGLLYLLPDYGLALPFQGMTYNLIYVPPDYYNNMNIGAGKGRPEYYTFQSGAYYLYWIPDQVYTINVTGVKDYAELSDANPTNDFTNFADSLLVYETLSRAYQLRDDIIKSDYFSSGAADEARKLRERTNTMEASGTMRVEYDNYYSSWI